jgi:hypothetical protein
MEGERELTTGLIPKSASSRLIVTGKIGPKEIDTLLRKLAIDMVSPAGSDGDGAKPVENDDE